MAGKHRHIKLLSISVSKGTKSSVCSPDDIFLSDVLKGSTNYIETVVHLLMLSQINDSQLRFPNSAEAVKYIYLSLFGCVAGKQVSSYLFHFRISSDEPICEGQACEMKRDREAIMFWQVINQIRFMSDIKRTGRIIGYVPPIPTDAVPPLTPLLTLIARHQQCRRLLHHCLNYLSYLLEIFFCRLAKLVHVETSLRKGKLLGRFVNPSIPSFHPSRTSRRHQPGR